MRPGSWKVRYLIPSPAALCRVRLVWRKVSGLDLRYRNFPPRPADLPGESRDRVSKSLDSTPKPACSQEKSRDWIPGTESLRRGRFAPRESLGTWFPVPRPEAQAGLSAGKVSGLDSEYRDLAPRSADLPGESRDRVSSPETRRRGRLVRRESLGTGSRVPRLRAAFALSRGRVSRSGFHSRDPVPRPAGLRRKPRDLISSTGNLRQRSRPGGPPAGSAR
jgi:hypothetical protein